MSYPSPRFYNQISTPRKFIAGKEDLAFTGPGVTHGKQIGI